MFAASLAERSGVLLPCGFVEVHREEPTLLIQQHRVDAQRLSLVSFMLADADREHLTQDEKCWLKALRKVASPSQTTTISS